MRDLGAGAMFLLKPWVLVASSSRASWLSCATLCKTFSEEDVFDYRVQIPKIAEALRKAVDHYNGNLDLAIASWTLGDRKLRQHLNREGAESIRKLLLDSQHPEQGRLGPNYIDFVKPFL